VRELVARVGVRDGDARQAGRSGGIDAPP
jgi:hypothetical protein